MATGVSSWSKTAATNATADSAVNWAEGQAPSSVNDSARGMMASVAKWRDDISGTITTGGSSTAYTATSNQSFASFSAMNGALLAIIPHTTSGAAPTLNIDGLGAKAINSATTVAVPTGALVAGTPYLVTYINASTEFIIVGQIGTLTSAQITALTATQADQETGTSTVLFVPPGRQHFNPKHAKAQCNFNGTGTVALAASSSGVSSITDNGTGNYTTNWTTAFSTALYSTPGIASSTTGGTGLILMADNGSGVYSAPATTSYQATAVSLAGTATDSPRVSISAFGDFA